MMSAGVRSLCTALATTLVFLSLFSFTPQTASSAPGYDGTTMHTLAGSNITVEIDKRAPSIIFYHPDEAQTRYKLQYTRLILFNDTGDSRYEGKEATYACDLMKANWESSAHLSSNATHGAEVRVVMTAMLDLTEQSRMRTRQGPGNGNGTNGNGTSGNGTGGKPAVIQNALEMRLEYVMTENNMSYAMGSNEFELAGESELKIDIFLVPKLPLQSSHAAIEQSLYEGSADRQFSICDASGPQIVKSGINEMQGNQEIMHQYTNAFGHKQRIGITTSEGKEKSYFTWVDGIIARKGASSTIAGIETSYRTDGVSLKLYNSFALSGADEYAIDPTVGVIPKALEQAVEDAATFVYNHRASLSLGLVVGVCAALAIVVATGYSGIKRRSKESIDSVRLESNRYYKGKK